MKRFLSIILAILLFMSLGACAVNSEKDAKSIVLEVGDTPYQKADFNNYFNMMKLVSEKIDSYTYPTDADEAKTAKTSIYDDYVKMKIFGVKAKALSIQIDEKAAKKQANSLYNQVITAIDAANEKDKTKRDSTLSPYGFTQNSLKEYMNSAFVEIYYSNALQNEFTQKGVEGFLTGSCVTVGKTEVPYTLFYYYLVNNALMKAVYGEDLPTDEAKFNEYLDGIMDTLIEDITIVNKAKEAGVTVTKDEIKKAYIDEESIRNLYGDDTVDSAFSQFYVTKATYKKVVLSAKEIAAYKEKYNTYLREKATVTDSEIKSYFAKNKKDFNDSTVSAMHILVTAENKDYGKAILKEVKSDGSNFSELIEKYKDDEKVKEATDLGEFGYGQMEDSFEDAAFSAKEGTVVSKLVKSQYGYHIIYVYKKNTVADPTFDAYKAEVEDAIRNKKATEQVEKLQKSALSSSNVKDRKEMRTADEMLLTVLKDEYSVKEYLKIALR